MDPVLSVSILGALSWVVWFWYCPRRLMILLTFVKSHDIYDIAVGIGLWIHLAIVLYSAYVLKFVS